MTWLCCYTEVGMKSGVCALVAPQALRPQHNLTPAPGACTASPSFLELEPWAFWAFCHFLWTHQFTCNALTLLPPGSLSVRLVDCRTLLLVPCWAADGCLVTLFSRLALKQKKKNTVLRISDTVSWRYVFQGEALLLASCSLIDTAWWDWQ